MQRAIFMDRDGTVSEEIGYMYDAALYRPFPFTGPAIRRINESGMKAVLITNQSGIERGYFSESTLNAVHDVLQTELSRHNARLDAIYYCPHHPDTGCECRKPRLGMLRRAEADLNIDLKNSFMIGDRFLDVRLAHAAGARAVLVLTGDGRDELQRNQDCTEQPHFIAENLFHAVEAILSGEAG